MSNPTDYRHERRDYHGKPLQESEFASDPLLQFQQWLSEALAQETQDATACSLATVNEQGQPSARIVLLKHMDHGLCWYTNYASRKAKDLAQNARACLLFFWPALSRQVRIEGHVEKLSLQAAQTYFQSRPRESQISAAASAQSEPIADRQSLENKAAQLRETYAGKTIPHPNNWGGYRLIPHAFEFWQGRENRLHDRLVYQRADKIWKIIRLQP